MALLTLDEAKAALNITQDTYNDELPDYIAGAEEAVLHICGAAESTPVTEVVELTGTQIPLSRFPVLEVDSVTGDLVGLVDAATYRTDFDAGVITAKGNAPALRPDTYTIVYATGRTTTPSAMKQAAKVILKHQWSTQRGASARRVATDDTTVVPGLGYAVPNAALQMLAPHDLGPAVA